MNFEKSFEKRNFFRFTGPPENWLTAIKYMTWGLERKYEHRWREIQSGDVFFMHSTSTGSKFKNARSSVIGFGVVGPNFSIKDSYLWIQENEKKINIWPLLVPFSEIYLFSEIPSSEDWEAPDLSYQPKIQHLIDNLLTNAVPMSSINGFPQMGSFSAVSNLVVQQIFNNTSDLHLIQKNEMPEKDLKQTPFTSIKDASESLRFAETLQLFDQVKRRVVNKKSSVYTKDNELLARAEDSHLNTLQELVDFFKSKNYDTYFNRRVDLFAVNETQTFTVEVKSIENRNFQNQARKGLIQLHEYEYFEVRKFLREEGQENKLNCKVLVPSQTPQDQNYIAFINYLDIEVGVMNNKVLEPVGKTISINKI
ncbi:MAG TPA: hypothetical protein PLD54_01495 [Candidatus Levybacteria bacterium]|nr:hypothetical protein [Candidatus Levybacteria bacterium]